MVVVKDNKIIEASYSLSLSEQRILLACISQINSKNPLQPENKFQVVASDIIDLMGLNRSNAYRDMKLAVDKLYNRSIKISGEMKEDVVARLTGNSLADFAKPGETRGQALERKKQLAEMKKILE